MMHKRNFFFALTMLFPLFLLGGCEEAIDAGGGGGGGGFGGGGGGESIVLPPVENIYYLSPTGSDANDGSENSEWATFEHAFASMEGSDALIIRDGVYDERFGTWQYDSSGKAVAVSNPPSGIPGFPTIIAAEHPGGVIINQDAWIGNDYLEILGLRFVSDSGGVASFSGNHINVRQTSFHGDQDGPEMICLVGASGSHILFEDSWVSGVGECAYFAGSGSRFDDTRGHHITYRRVVMSLQGYEGSLEYVGILLYGAKDILVENAIAIDFAPISDTPFDYKGGIYSRVGYGAARHDYYGSLVLNNPFDGFLLTVGGCENCVAWDVGGHGFRQRNQATETIGHVVHKVTVGDAGTGVMNFSHAYSNALVVDSGPGSSRIGGEFHHTFNSTVGSEGSNTLVNVNPELKYITRIESGAPGFRNGLANASRGADLLFRYVNGVETNEPLWPWPHEDRIKKEMCTDIGVTDGFCAAGNGLYGGPITLTSYIWEYLGNACPTSICEETDS